MKHQATEVTIYATARDVVTCFSLAVKLLHQYVRSTVVLSEIWQVR